MPINASDMACSHIKPGSHSKQNPCGVRADGSKMAPNKACMEIPLSLWLHSYIAGPSQNRDGLVSHPEPLHLVEAHLCCAGGHKAGSCAGGRGSPSAPPSPTFRRS